MRDRAPPPGGAKTKIQGDPQPGWNSHVPTTIYSHMKQAKVKPSLKNATMTMQTIKKLVRNDVSPPAVRLSVLSQNFPLHYSRGSAALKRQWGEGARPGHAPSAH